MYNVKQLYLFRAFADNDKPLLENSPEHEDSWEGWGDTWGKGDSLNGEKAQEADNWDSWSNEKSPQKSSKVKDQDWNTEEWSGFSDQPKAAKSKSSHKKSKTKSSAKSAEPATANLIDFGSEGNGTTNEGWDNEVWAQNDEDDAWQSLELDSGKASKNIPKAKSKKGD